MIFLLVGISIGYTVGFLEDRYFHHRKEDTNE